MNTDIALVTGLVMVVLSIPAIFSAFSEGRAPRVAAVLLVVGGRYGGLGDAWQTGGNPSGRDSRRSGAGRRNGP